MTISTEQFVTIAVGTTANDGTGDILRDAFIKVNNNFANITDIGIDTGNINVQGEIESSGNITTTDYFVGNLAGNLYGNIAQAFSIFGNVTFSGTGRRIFGDFSAAAPNDRLMFQTLATNGVTDVAVIPSGTAVSSKLSLFNAADATDASRLELVSTGTEVSIKSTYEGVGTYLPLTIETGGAERVRVALNGNVTISGNTAINKDLTVVGNVTAGYFIGDGSQLTGISSDSNVVSGSRDTVSSDNGKILINSSASNYTLTIPAGMPTDFGFAFIQGSTGTCTIAANGVSLIGSTLSTTSAGDLLAVIWVAANTYVVKAS